MMRRTHPEDRSAVQQLVDRASRDRTEYDLEHRLLMPDGSVKHVRVVGRPSTDERGRFEFVGALMDVTERKRAEEERERLRQVQADLARVTRVTTMGELTASVAHEINQPIAAAITNANTCLRWLTRDPPDVEEAREAASRSAKDATRAADIIKRIRLLFKKGTPQREPVDVNEVIRDVIILLRNEAYRYSVSIHTDLARDFSKVMADRVQLQQVLTNLMLNGIEAMKEVDAARELTIRSEQADNGHLLISVSDTGVGLAPEQAEQIFNAFFTTKPDGTGMGLPISRSIIESHGGRLWATANSEQGATFQFTLPKEVREPE
jgi:C4-dicarboxylate-specific signal transduction histidine kinase